MKNDYQNIYFLGIGGIGMSAIARYFLVKGYPVAGYDRTPSAITDALQKECVSITFREEPDDIPEPMRDPKLTLVVYTPAVPQDSPLMAYFREGGFTMMKRAEVLGYITRSLRALCVAGTHGKTTTSTMLAHLLYQSEIGTNAFLGGISRNYGTNFLLQPESSLVVVEADEFDRSFHHLTPSMAIITSADPDHLDIYGTAEAYRESFEIFTSLIRPGGALLLKKGVQVTPQLKPTVRLFTYGVEDPSCDFYADHITTEQHQIYFDFHTPQTTLTHIRLGVPVWINIENATAAMAMAWMNGVTENELRLGMASFQGCQRRFNIVLQTERVVLIDDYAHHPDELEASIHSVQRLYPERTLVTIFQPHLYTRTRDLQEGFARVLSEAEHVLLLPIYPARELPIPGVSSALILDKLTTPYKMLCQKEELIPSLQAILDAQPEQPFVFLMAGAGDIDRLVGPTAQAFK